MKMKEVCEKTGLTKKAIHYYIDCDLIHVDKLDNNYFDFIGNFGNLYLYRCEHKT